MVSLAEIVGRIVCERRVLALFGVVGGSLALLYLAVSPATYQAETKIVVDPRPLRLPSQKPRSQPIDESRTAMSLLEGEVRVLRSAPVLLDVVERLRLDEDPEFEAADASTAGRIWQTVLALVGASDSAEPAASAKGVCFSGADGARDCPTAARSTALRSLQKAVTIQRGSRSFVIAVRARSEDRAKAMRIADAIVSSYTSESRKRGAERRAEAQRAIASGLSTLEDNLRTKDRQIDEARRRLGAVGGSEGDVDEQQVKQVTSDLVAARAYASSLKVRSDQLAKLARSGGDLDTETFPDAPALESLRVKAASLARREGAAAAKLGPRHPDVAVLAEQRSRLQTLLRQELARTAEAIRHDYEQARAKEDLLSARADELESKILADGQARVALRQLERVAKADGRILATSSRRAVELAQDDAVGEANVRVLGPATTPNGPATPRLTLVAAAIAAGLTTGAAFAATRTRPADVGPGERIYLGRAVSA